MTCNCPKCSTPAVEPMLTPPMFYLRQEYDGQTFAITSPMDLSSKPGGVIATTGPNYLSIKGDRWVSSNGTILTCEELFEELTNAKDTELVYLSNYDFQEMQ
nr:MAG TPA: hypothetical protein [Caudoviricetes sp.]